MNYKKLGWGLQNFPAIQLKTYPLPSKMDIPCLVKEKKQRLKKLQTR